MADILIKGMKMPTERESFNLTIKYNGTVLDTETGIQVAEAYEVPPHGRLGDLDELYAHLNEWYLTHSPGFTKEEAIYIRAMLVGIAEAPTIIPAEPVEEIKDE